MGTAGQTNGFDAIRTRLEEIADAVGNEEMPLDEALDLYEEAVALGLRATDMLEEGISVIDAQSDESAQDGEPVEEEGA